MAPHEDGSPRYLWEPVCSQRAVTQSSTNHPLTETASSLFLQQHVLQNPGSITPAAVSEWTDDGECGKNMVTCTVTLKIRVPIYLQSCLGGFFFKNISFYLPALRCLTVHVFQTNPIRGKQRRGRNHSSECYAFIKSCCS